MNKNENKKSKELYKEEYNKGNKKINENKENEGNILDTLFFKTKTKPYIYYLPLTDEQVKQKLENRNK